MIKIYTNKKKVTDKFYRESSQFKKIMSISTIFIQLASDTLHSVVTSESKSNLKQHTQQTHAEPSISPTTTPVTASITPHSLIVGNHHLDIPTGNNPNLLSPDILNQRRGNR